MNRARSLWHLHSARIVLILDRPKTETKASIAMFDVALSDVKRAFQESTDIFQKTSLYLGLEIVTTPRHLGQVGSLKYYREHRHSAIHAVVQLDGVKPYDSSTDEGNVQEVYRPPLTDIVGFFDIMGDDEIKATIDLILILKLLLCDESVNYVRMMQQPECARRRAGFDESRLNVTMHTRPTYAARLDDSNKCSGHKLTNRLRMLHELSDGSHFATWDFYEHTVIPHVDKIHEQHGFHFTDGLGKIRNWADSNTFVRDAGMWAFNTTQ